MKQRKPASQRPEELNPNVSYQHDLDERYRAGVRIDVFQGDGPQWTVCYDLFGTDGLRASAVGALIINALMQHPNYPTVSGCGVFKPRYSLGIIPGGTSVAAVYARLEDAVLVANRLIQLRLELFESSVLTNSLSELIPSAGIMPQATPTQRPSRSQQRAGQAVSLRP